MPVQVKGDGFAGGDAKPRFAGDREVIPAQSQYAAVSSSINQGLQGIK